MHRADALKAVFQRQQITAISRATGAPAYDALHIRYALQHLTQLFPRPVVPGQDLYGIQALIDPRRVAQGLEDPAAQGTAAHGSGRTVQHLKQGVPAGSVRKVAYQLADGQGAFGYNAANGEFGDMIEFGILDPTKVTRTALQNAASIAGLMITTEAMVAELPKKEEPAMPGGGMGGMGGMDF